MRSAIILALAAGLAAAEPAAPAQPPAASQKLIDASTEVAVKAHDAYLQAVKKEQDKLVLALQKEQEKATKKGDLETALAIKAQIADVQGGLLVRLADNAKDLLGDQPTPAAAPGTTPAGLASDCPIGSETFTASGAPKEVEAAMARSTRVVLPKGDKTHYTFTCTHPGTVVVATGGSERNNGELWAELQRAGFKRLDDASMAWWHAELKAGQKFTCFDPPLAAAQAVIYAGRFTHAK